MNKRRYYTGNLGSVIPILHRQGVILLPVSFVIGLTGLFLLGSHSVLESLLHDLGIFLLVVTGVCLLAGIISAVLFFAEPPAARSDLPEMNNRARKMANKIRRKFDDSKLVEVLKVAPKTRWGYELPVVEVYVADNLLSGYVLIENLGIFQSLDRAGLNESISGVLGGRRLAGLEVVRSEMTLGGLFVRFDFEDLKRSVGLRVKSGDLSAFISSDKHDIRLAPDATWHARKFPMLSIIARTGAGKSVLAGAYIARLAQMQGWQVSYNSAKKDNYVLEFGGKSKPSDIVDQAETYVEIMQRRLEQIAVARKSDYAELNMPDILLVFDELGNLNAHLTDDKKLQKRWESALKSLSMTGRSAGIHLLLISQFGTVDGFVVSSVRAQVSDNVIMLGNAASSASERQYVLGGYSDMPSHYYGIGEGLALISGSGRKWQEPHLFKAPWFE